LATIKKRLPKKYHLATRKKETSPKKEEKICQKKYTQMTAIQKHI